MSTIILKSQTDRILDACNGTLGLKEAVAVTLSGHEPCPSCNGTGLHPSGDDRDCRRCKGIGEVAMRKIPPALPLVSRHLEEKADGKEIGQ